GRRVDGLVDIEHDGGPGIDDRAGQRVVAGLDGVAYETFSSGGLIVGRQEAGQGVGGRFAGERIDGLEHPGDEAGNDINSGSNIDNEAGLIRQIHAALEEGLQAVEVHVDIAPAEVGDAERAEVQV